MEKEYYQKIKVHKGLEKKGDSSNRNKIVHKVFEIKGKYDFEGLDLRENGWKQVHPCNNRERTEDQETLVYAGPQGIAVMCLNYKTDYHQIEVILNNHYSSDPLAVEGIKFMFERNLEGKLNDVELNIIDDIKQN